MLKRTVCAGATLFVSVAAVAQNGCATTRPATPQPVPAQRGEFPFEIAFEQGATKFQPGDRITITAVYGTSSDMESGICRISGTYSLASHETATLAASVTAREAADGSGSWNSAQKMTVTRGHGTFTLLLPISIRGWPHVSFYGKSSDFGGNYIGTGDSVLPHWWGS